MSCCIRPASLGQSLAAPADALKHQPIASMLRSPERDRSLLIGLFPFAVAFNFPGQGEDGAVRKDPLP
jgi:hypothetical protein